MYVRMRHPFDGEAAAYEHFAVAHVTAIETLCHAAYHDVCTAASSRDCSMLTSNRSEERCARYRGFCNAEEMGQSNNRITNKHP